MSSISKFEFDTVFDLDEKGRARQKPAEPVFSEAEVMAARAEAQQIGFEAGVSQTRREIEFTATNALQAIADRLPAMAGRHEQAMLLVKEESARLAYIVAAKLAPALIGAAPEAEIENLLGGCLSTMLEEPRLVIRLPEPLMEHLPAALEQVAAQSGYAGKLVIIGEPSLSGGDCRIEWADGGAERDMKTLLAKVDAAIERYCAGVHDQAERLDSAADAADAAEQAAPDVEAPSGFAEEPWPDSNEAPGGIDAPLPALSGSRGAPMPASQTNPEPPVEAVDE